MIGRRLQHELMRRLVNPALLTAGRAERELSRLRRGRDGARSGRGAGPFGPPLECGRRLKELMSRHYLDGRTADGAVPVAWVTSGFPVEVLRPFGFFAVYPENHGALCSAQRLVPELAGVAEGAGYSQDLCGYARTDIGSVLSGRTPVGRLPRPDLLACCTNICQTVLYWYRALAAHLRVPLVVIDTPHVYGEQPAHHLAYVKDQLAELLAVAGEISGRRVAYEELEEVGRLAREGCELWGACLATGRRRPSPWTTFDAFVHMAPIVALRGTEACNAYYRALRDELRDRVDRGVGGVRVERHRLLWDNLPIWHRMRDLATVFAEAGFNFVCATYTSAWAEPAIHLDERAPVTSIARAYSSVLLNRDLPHRLAGIERLAREYEVDGVVLHSDRSCKPYSVGQIDLRERLARDLGVRALLLEADHADPRAWSAESADTRIRAFLESFA